VSFAGQTSFVSVESDATASTTNSPRRGEATPAASYQREQIQGSSDQADFLAALDGTYDMDDTVSDDMESSLATVVHAASADAVANVVAPEMSGATQQSEPRRPLWRLRMERTQRIQSARQAAIVAYNEEHEQSHRLKTCVIL